ncbi:MAG: serine/threonine-protein phosphatase [Brevinematales bacterium]|nr:serine/threonine-protein phosphatase [Brevinematales bacterium]
MFPNLSSIMILVYSLTVIGMVFLYKANLSLSKNFLVDFVEIIFTRMYDFPNRKDFFNVIKSIFNTIGLKVNNVSVYMDTGHDFYELVGTDSKINFLKGLPKDGLLISEFISSNKARLPFIDTNNTTLVPKSVFESSYRLMLETDSNFIIPIYSPNYDLIGLVFFRSDTVSFRKLFYMSQFINILGMMFKTITDAEKKKVLEEDLKIASQIQSRLIPTNYINNKWFESYGVYIPAYNIGGDYLDIIEGENIFSFTIGDVAGKGVSAGLVAMMVKAIINSILITPKNLGSVVKSVNSFIYKHLYSEESLMTFITLFILTYIPKSKMLYYINAGHVPGILVKNKDIILLNADTRPLGIFEKIDFVKKSVTVNTGDMLVLYTDGLIEQIDRRGREFGISRLKDILVSLNQDQPKEIVEKLIENLKEFSDQEISDDVCILVVKFK